MILNLNGSRWLTGLYDSLRADGYENKRVYLVDNGSVDGSQQFTRDRYPEVSVIQMPRNLGYSMAYNAAAATAFADGCNWIVGCNRFIRSLRCKWAYWTRRPHRIKLGKREHRCNWCARNDRSNRYYWSGRCLWYDREYRRNGRDRGNWSRR